MQSDNKKDLDEGKDKIYMNLSIHYASSAFSSLAAGNFNLLQPVVDHGGNFQLTITDIQVDTRLIPLFIAELREYQEYQYLYPSEMTPNNGLDTWIYLNYWVQMGKGGEYGERVYLKKKVVKQMKSTFMKERGKYAYDNSDKNLYIYSYQEFLDMVNEAIYEALPSNCRTRNACGFIIRKNKLVFLIQNDTIFNEVTKSKVNRLEIRFSYSLFQYLGVGFPIVNEYPAWKLSFSRELSYEHQYYALVQNESSLPSWNCCKAIVVYSHNFPVSEEIFPTLEIKNDLTHYSTQDYNIKYVYGTSELKKKIIYIYYIDYNKHKTLTNGISDHNNNIENGIKIDLEKALPINKFDINIGWLDCYGNLFPLELPHGGCCNIRMCFSRRANIDYFDYTNFNNINHMIQPYYMDDQQQQPFEISNYYPGMEVNTPYITPSIGYEEITPSTMQEEIELKTPDLGVPIEPVPAVVTNLEEEINNNGEQEQGDIELNNDGVQEQPQEEGGENFLSRFTNRFSNLIDSFKININ